jgi:Tfp pilus assembly protein FimT
MRNLGQKGITLIEILMVLSILIILLVVSLPQFTKIRENQVLKTATNDVISVLNKAHSQTLSSVDSSEYGVHLQSDRVIIFKGKIFSAGTETNETILIVSPASISNVTLGGVSGTSGDVYFNRLSGAPSSTGTITISNSSMSKIITISTTGAVSSN